MRAAHVAECLRNGVLILIILEVLYETAETTAVEETKVES